ncbi:type II toxin-antitoxin system RelE/ParE family toxin [Thermodesulfobacteriota bacterium]
MIKGTEDELLPPVRVVFYREDDGTVEMSDWLEQQSAYAQDRCIDRLKKLRSLGHELRRPLAAPLGNGIYELRVREKKVRLRMLYFFSGREIVVVTHGTKKKTAEVPQIEINRALDKRKKFQANPEAHTFNWEPDNE